MNSLRRYECGKHGGGENKGGFCYNCANEQETQRQANELSEFRSKPGNRSTLREKLRIAERRIEKLSSDLQSAGELYAISVHTIEQMRESASSCVGCECEPEASWVHRTAAECLSCSRYHEDNFKKNEPHAIASGRKDRGG